jgi:outer membrane biosynthesis protein TonB
MKTRFLTSITVVLLLITSAMAETNSSANADSPSATARLLEKNIVYPYSAANNQVSGMVEVVLRVGEDEKLEIVKLQSDEKLLAKSLEKQIKRLNKQLVKSMEPGTAQKFKFIFTL